MAGAPLIGITAATDQPRRRYVEAIERSGGVAWVIRPEGAMALEETLSRIDGLLLSGGADIHAAWYGGADGSAEGSARDAVELPLLRAALDRDLPVLGICRGMQAINVVMEGSLASGLDAHDAMDEDMEKSAYHRIYISPGSKLAAIVGSGGFVRVNSRHHRGVREGQKSPHLLASAYSLDDGVIEGLESPEHGWVVGVQFHPERRMELPPHFQRLFQSFVERSAPATRAALGRGEA